MVCVRLLNEQKLNITVCYGSIKFSCTTFIFYPSLAYLLLRNLPDFGSSLQWYSFFSGITLEDLSPRNFTNLTTVLNALRDFLHNWKCYETILQCSQISLISDNFSIFLLLQEKRCDPFAKHYN